VHRAVLLEHATKNEDYPEGELRGGVQEVVGGWGSTPLGLEAEFWSA
jgi:hypothetical protein